MSISLSNTKTSYSKTHVTNMTCTIERLILWKALGGVEGFRFSGGSGVQQPMESANGLKKRIWMAHDMGVKSTGEALKNQRKDLLLKPCGVC